MRREEFAHAQRNPARRGRSGARWQRLTHRQPTAAQLRPVGSVRRIRGSAATAAAAAAVLRGRDRASNPSERRARWCPSSATGRPACWRWSPSTTQRVTIYDSSGRKILQSSVSTGSNGYETPAGIYSVVQKKPEHNSNLYQDGNMPFMQRITWTGIALHAGVLPGYPASHGCVRMPIAFAQKLFELTDVGMRVVIVPSDMPPPTSRIPSCSSRSRCKPRARGRSLPWLERAHAASCRSQSPARPRKPRPPPAKPTRRGRAPTARRAECHLRHQGGAHSRGRSRAPKPR